MQVTIDSSAAHRSGVYAWLGAVTPRVDGFSRIRSSARDAAYMRFRETAPRD